MNDEQSVTIRGQRAKLFRESHEFGPAIYLMTDGRFAVKWGNKWVVRSSVAAIDKYTKKGIKSIKLMQVNTALSQSSKEVRVEDVAEFIGDNKILTADGKKKYRGYGFWFVFDQKIHDELIKLEEDRVKAQTEYNRRFTKITKKAKPVFSYTFKDLLSEDKANVLPGQQGQE